MTTGNVATPDEVVAMTPTDEIVPYTTLGELPGTICAWSPLAMSPTPVESTVALTTQDVVLMTRN
jgi:hypothetical protein